jgi:osmotically-inducible protein OsmY
MIPQMTKRCVVAATMAAWSIAGAAFAGPTIQDKPKDSTAAVHDDAAAVSKPAAGKTESAAKNGGKVVGDDALTTDVKARLAKNKAARNGAIDVAAKDGVVTLTGTVAAANDKVTVGRLVETTKGVKSVVNDLTVAKSTK